MAKSFGKNSRTQIAAGGIEGYCNALKNKSHGREGVQILSRELRVRGAMSAYRAPFDQDRQQKNPLAKRRRTR